MMCGRFLLMWSGVSITKLPCYVFIGRITFIPRCITDSVIHLTNIIYHYEQLIQYKNDAILKQNYRLFTEHRGVLTIHIPRMCIVNSLRCEVDNWLVP